MGFTLPELMSYLDSGVPAIETIQGLSYRGKTGVNFHNPDRRLLEEMELDSLPIPYPPLEAVLLHASSVQ